MKIVSLNAWGGQVWDALRPWLSTLEPDVLCLQEVTRAPVPSPEWLRYVDPYRDLAQRADLFGDVSALLPEHQAFFAPATRGTLTYDAGEAVPSEHGLGLWVRRGMAVTQIVQDFVHGSYRADGWGAEPVPRTMQVARVADPSRNRAICVGHFHGLRDPNGKGDTPAREAQTTRAVALFQQVWDGGPHAVLAGDFNILPDSSAFPRFRQAGLHDLIAYHGITDTRTALYEKPQRFADYMLVSDGLLSAEFDVPAQPVVSDHRPLILRF
ncbi:endonuclease/exonuclease/phosphatase family protein [Tateyamaria omphalii]|uniref:endonuclease/exonuclease/phosphatase family protein n=1 Tax=Tateyamaria omphalii TaxID=299262 RepID=UPI001C99627B|nr:endonuclease/exonuclease/phosphatase family protein [Tateyamaria omphalii]MBY5932657.1 endonuclease/exonuclease/phosphatase family protein [Tateyamaria omphalii]